MCAPIKKGDKVEKAGSVWEVDWVDHPFVGLSLGLMRMECRISDLQVVGDEDVPGRDAGLND